MSTTKAQKDKKESFGTKPHTTGTAKTKRTIVRVLNYGKKNDGTGTRTHAVTESEVNLLTLI